MKNCLFECMAKMAETFATPACLGYLALIYALGFLALPLAHRFLHRTRIAWYAASRLLGLSLLTYAAWVLGHDAHAVAAADSSAAAGGFAGFLKRAGGNGFGLVPYRAQTLYALLAVGAVFSAWGYARWGREMLARVRRCGKAIVCAEAVFLLAFAFGCVLRMYSEGIRNYEKPMDFAFLNSCIYNPALPPPDPWRYDGFINYYYGGYLQMATLAKMTGVAPEYAYNISVAVVFALTCLLSFALVFELASRVRWALLGVATVALMGNLHAATQTWRYWIDSSPTRRLAIDWWAASRVILDGPPGEKQLATINEFPFFSWFHADLHPHMVAVPFALLFLAATFNLLRSRGLGLRGFGRGGWKWARLALTAWTLGSLAMINGFDFIVGVPLLSAVLLVREWLRGRGWRGAADLNLLFLLAALCAAASWGVWRFRAILTHAYAPAPAPGGAALLAMVVLLAAGALSAGAFLVRSWRNKGRPAFHLGVVAGEWILIVALAVALFAPFFLNYRAPVNSRPFVRPPSGVSLGQALENYAQRDMAVGAAEFRSGAGEYFTMWGTQILLVVVCVLVSLLPAVRRLKPENRLLAWCAVAALWVACLVWEGTVVTATLLSLLFLVPVGFAASRKTPSRAVAFVLLTVSAAILLSCEHLYIRDMYGRGLQRMNTLFKFFFATWILLGLATPFCLAEVARSALLPRWGRFVLCLGGILFIAAGTVYPVSVSCQRITSYHPGSEGPADLDGMKYLKRDEPGDWAAIQWLREHGKAGQTVLEAPGQGGYSYHGRIATHTPLRAVLGWAGHESIWRGEYPGAILSDARTMFSDPDMNKVRPLLDKYGVDYVYVGRLEKSELPPAGLAKFGPALPVAYEDAKNGVTIYSTRR